MKFYCDNCYYYRPPYFADSNYYNGACKCIEAWISKDTPICIEYDDDPKNINENNDCKYHSIEKVVETHYVKLLNIVIAKKSITKIVLSSSEVKHHLVKNYPKKFHITKNKIEKIIRRINLLKTLQICLNCTHYKEEKGLCLLFTEEKGFDIKHGTFDGNCCEDWEGVDLIQQKEEDK